MPSPDQRAFHASINIADLARSVAFYRALFGTQPVKQRHDYAKFELEHPPLVLSLIPGRPTVGGSLNHFGLRVPDSEALVAIQLRLELAGMATQREEGISCCHSTQTKFWISDPDRVQWEIYVLHDDADEDDGDHAPHQEPVPAPHLIWQHHLGEPWPTTLPHDGNSLHEVLLEGTANASPQSVDLTQALTEALRVLRPGGELCLHGLSADVPLSVPLPKLPGPAAVVEYVPPHADVVRALVEAGFVGVVLEKLSSTAHFTVANVALRELVIIGTKPGHRPRQKSHQAVYLGPLANVTDDFGNRYERGALTALNIHDWQALSKGPSAHQFLLLK